jgi:hypothetical protein
MLENLDNWLKEEPVLTTTPFENWSPVIRRRPKGICLILGSVNFLNNRRKSTNEVTNP